ncbi:MAG TPA: hypothetical protein VFV37_03235, partial [Luteibaculaceae bacterium]|nr:hypothetical protein [Luteibaculaceae bacterium]
MKFSTRAFFGLILVLSFTSGLRASATPTPPPPTVNGSTTVCLGTSALLTASISPSNPNVIFRWHQEVLLGIYSQVFEGNPFTPSPLLTTNYYVVAVDTTDNQVSAPTYFTLNVAPANLDVVAATPADLLLCNGDSTLFTATSTLGNSQFEWYDALVGGNVVFNGNPYQSGGLTTVPTLYVASVDINGCRSPRIAAVTPVVLPAVSLPIPVPIADQICSGQSSTFTVSGIGGDTLFFWYDALTGGNQLATGNTFTTDTIVNNGLNNIINLYYVESSNADGCRSTRVPVTQTVLPAVNAAVVDTLVDIVCSGNAASFTATSLLPGAQFNWYDALIGGNLLFTGNPFVTPADSNNTASDLIINYYVEVVDTNGCSSLRTPAVKIASPALDVPVVTPISSLICSGDSVTFNATALLGSLDFVWYDGLLGGNALATGSSYTASFTNTTGLELIETIYVATRDTNGCESLRTPAVITVRPAIDAPLVTPLADTICNGGVATFSASSLLGNGIFRWYNTATGGPILFQGNPYTTDTLFNSGASDLVRTYFAESVDSLGCTSLRTPALVVIQPALNLVTVNPPAALACNGSSTTFTASSVNGATNFKWYDALTNGNLLFEGNPYTLQATNTDSLLSNQIVYVASTDANGCTSLRTPVVQTVTPALDAPLVTPILATICSSDSVILTATPLIGTTAQIRWYDALVGGNPLDSGASYTFKPSMNQTLAPLVYNIYAELEDSSGCRSLRGVSTITVLPVLEVPTVTPPVQTVCSGQATQFIAGSTIGAGAQYFWYDSLIGGTLLFTGPTFTTPVITSSGPADVSRIYYVEVRDANNCASLRVPATVLIVPSLDVPIPTPIIDTICNGGTAQFVASSALGTASNYYWYDSLSAGNLLATGDTFSTGPIVSANPLDVSRTYYLELEDSSGCRSIRVPATVVISISAELPTINPALSAICNGDSAVFNASVTLGSAAAFNWYDSLLASQPIFTGPSFNTGPIFSTGPLDVLRNFYVSAVDSNGCESIRAVATVAITPSAALPIVDNPVQTICNGRSATFVVSTLDSATYTFNWYDSISGGTLLFTGDTFVTTPYVSSSVSDLSRVYYVEAVDSAGCRSLRSVATTLIAPILDVPTVDPAVQLVCNNASATFVASSLLGTGIRFRWYDAPTNGTFLFEGDTFVSPPITNPSSLNLNYGFFVEAIDSTGCQSVRVPGIAIVRPAIDLPVVTPLVDTVCSGGSAEFVASAVIANNATFKWYDNAIGGNLLFEGDTFNTGPIANQGTTDLVRIYYVEITDSLGCTSLRTPATALIKPALDIVLLDSVINDVCNGQSATFRASSVVNPDATYRWYDSLVGGNLLFEGNPFTTPPLTHTGSGIQAFTYFVESVDSAGCSSVRTAAIALVRPQVEVPLVSPTAATICSGTTAQFIAQSLINNNDSYVWYDTLVSGTAIFIGDTFTTPKLTNTTLTSLIFTYGVEARDTVGCTSIRVPVLVTVLPAVPTSSAFPVSPVCSGTSAELIVTHFLDTTLTVNWYGSLFAETPIFVGDTFVTPPLENNSTTNITRDYYYETVDSSGCTSARLPVAVVILPGLTPPVVDPLVVTVCDNSRATFVASTVDDPALVKFAWYDSIVQGNKLFEGDTFITPVLSAVNNLPTTYRFYVESVDSLGCRSIRSIATALVAPSLAIPTVSPTSQAICSGDSAQFIASSVFSDDVTFLWYDNATEGNLLFVGDTFNTGAVVNS